jgi:hypothetical protein
MRSLLRTQKYKAIKQTYTLVQAQFRHEKKMEGREKVLIPAYIFRMYLF